LGRRVAHLALDWQSWLDPSTPPLERLRRALVPTFDDAAHCPPDLLFLYTAVMSQGVEPIGFKLSRTGRDMLQKHILARKNDYETIK
jgi:hypothetical protein